MVKRLRVLCLLLLIPAVLGLACSMPALVPTAQPLPSPSPTWTLLPALTQAPPTAEPPSPEPSATPEVATSTLEPAATVATPTVEPFVCPNAPTPRLEVGEVVRVTFTDGLPLRVRETPVVNNTNIITQIQEGTQMTVIDGPRCAPIPDTGSSFVFWKIEVTATGLTGWVAEGDSSAYYIEPVP